MYYFIMDLTTHIIKTYAYNIAYSLTKPYVKKYIIKKLLN